MNKNEEELEDILLEYLKRNNIPIGDIEFIMEAFHALKVKTRFDTIQEIKNAIELDNSILISTSSSKYVQ